MRCANCGAEVREGVPFCSECGRPLREGAKQAKKTAKRVRAPGEPKPKKKVKWKLVLFLVILAAVLGSAGYAYLRLPAFRVDRALKSDGYQTAAKVYSTEVRDGFFENWLTALLCRDDLSKASEAYFAGELSYDEAKAFYTAFSDEENTRLSREAEKQLAAIEADHAARDALAAGDAALEAEDFQTAMEAYAKVPEDSSVYGDAQKKLQDAQKQYVQSVSDSVDKLVGKGSYADAIRAIDAALKLVPKDAALLEKRATIGSAFEAVTLDQITDDVNKEDYAAAIQTLEEALEVMPDSTKLSDRLEELRDAQKKQDGTTRSI